MIASPKNVNMKELAFLLILFVSLVTCSCQSNKENRLHQVSDELTAEFVELRYKGGFRSDTIFGEKLKAQLELAKGKNINRLVLSTLEIAIEYDLLKGDYLALKDKLGELSSYGSTNLNPSYNWLQSYCYANQENYDSAITKLNELSRNENLSDRIRLKTYWLLGSIFEETGVDSLAIKYYENAIEIGPVENEIDYYLESTFHLAHMKYREGEIEQAEILYKKALKESIEYKVNRLVPFGYYHLGKIEENNNQSNSALDYYQKSRIYLIHELREPEHFIIPLLNKKIEALE